MKPQSSKPVTPHTLETAFTALVSLLLLCCSAPLPPDPSLPVVTRPPLSPREVAIYRALITPLAGFPDGSAIGLVDEEGERDLPPEILRWFRWCNPPLRGLRDAIEGADGVYSRSTGRQIVTVRLGKIRWLGPQEVVVSLHWFADGVTAMGYDITLREQPDGEWKVIEEKVTLVS